MRPRLTDAYWLMSGYDPIAVIGAGAVGTMIACHLLSARRSVDHEAVVAAGQRPLNGAGLLDAIPDDAVVVEYPDGPHHGQW